MELWRRRLARRIAELDLTPAEVARRSKVGNTMIHDILKRDSTPSVQNLRKIAKTLGWSLNNLFEDTTTDGVHLNIDFKLMDNGMLSDVVPDDAKSVPLDFLDQDLATLAIESNEHRTAGYRHGDVVSGPRYFGKSVHNLMGQECIVETTSGERHFKILAKSVTPGRYTLKSFDPTVADIADVKVRWAAPIKVIVRNS